MSQTEAKSHHFVPQWYQRQFLPAGKSEFFVFDKSPVLAVRCPDGIVRKVAKPKEIRRSGTGALFEQEDLYAVAFSKIRKDILERALFGPLDKMGATAHSLFRIWPKTPGVVFREWDALPKHLGHPSDQMIKLVNFMDAQKGRTPKGLDQIRNALAKFGHIAPNNNVLMQYLQRRRQRNCTVWIEGVWEIFSAENSATKFLLSDDPVVIYNMDCFSGSVSCVYPNDPDTFWRGSRVLYPLSRDLLLVISHAEHFDDPRRSLAKRDRRNARSYDQAIANFTDIINEREFDAGQVAQVNHVIKARASRFVASACEQDLFPETSEAMPRWCEIDNLFKPEHPTYHSSSTMMAKFGDGSLFHTNAYGESGTVPGWFIKQQEALGKKGE